MSASVVSLVDFGMNFVLLLVLMVCLSIYPSSNIIYLPMFTLLAVFAALGPALFLTALNVKYRDFRYIVPFLIQTGLYLISSGIFERDCSRELAPSIQLESARWCDRWF
jgi:lipopolysaccharide transport system permease protein